MECCGITFSSLALSYDGEEKLQIQEKQGVQQQLMDEFETEVVFFKFPGEMPGESLGGFREITQEISDGIISTIVSYRRML